MSRLAEVRAYCEAVRLDRRGAPIVGWKRADGSVELLPPVEVFIARARSDLPLLLGVAEAAAEIRGLAEREMARSHGEGYSYELGRRDACVEILARLEAAE